MAKLVKIALISILGLVALFVVAAVILVATVDPNDYKDQIAQEVKAATGRDLVFEGDIGFNFFPWLGLKVGPVGLGNRAGFKPAQMVHINKAEASIEIMPLFSGRISIGTVVLDGFTANLTVNEKGVNNWDDLSASKGESTAKPAEAPSAEQGTAKSAKKAPDLTVGGVEITNANITYEDRKGGSKSSVTNLNLIIGRVGDKVTTPIELTFDLALDNGKITTRPKLTAMLTPDIEAGSVKLVDLVFTLLNLKMTGDFFAKTTDKDVAYSGELKVAEMSVKELMKQVGMEPIVTADPAALTKVGALVKVNGSANAVSLENLTVKLDDTNITGTGSVKNFAKPAITVAVNVDDIDADRYMPPASDKKEKAKEKPAETTSSAPAEEPDLSAVRDLDLKAKLTVGKLKAMNAHVSEILCDLVAKNGIVTIKPFSAKLYEGGLEAHSVIDVNGKLAAWKESATLSGVQAGPLLKDLVGKDHVTGATQAKYDVTGSGLTPVNIKKTLSGTASFAFTDGAVNGINVAKMLRDAINTIKGKPVSADAPERTDFAELSGSTQMTNGHIVNEDLLMKSPLLRINGKGWVNLPKNNLDYRTTATVVGTLKGQEGEDLKDLAGVPVPVYAKGSLDDPKFGLDTKALGEALFKSKLKESITGGSTGTKSGTTDDKKEPLNILKKLF